jgi:threonine dehydrogenase-like Zn-dependent dehydrogenase
MHASGICYTDVHQTLGHLPGPFPRILGHEPVGEIVATAPDVTARKVGDRVGSAWIQSTCGRGLLRQYFPKNIDLTDYSQSDLDKVALRLNQRPRKTLGFQTPASKLQESVASTH